MKMDTSFENMLYLLGNGATGSNTTVPDTENIDVEAIRKYATEQNVWTIIYKPLSKLCDVSRYETEVIVSVLQGIRQREFQYEMIRKLESSGVGCCIIKGMSVAMLYKDPDCRLSGDVDVLINSKDEEKALELLKENGYNITNRRDKNSHHSVAKHQIGGTLELHTELYSYIYKNIIFNGLELYNEPQRVIEINGEEYKTLGINDGLMYLTAHYIKHFINCGGGVRQMMDLLLYIKKYENEIDFELYEERLNQLSYKKLIDTVKAIGAKYFGFDFEIKNTELMEKILEDTRTGGIFGHERNANIRNGFRTEFCKRRSDASKLNMDYMLLFKLEKNIFQRIFISKKRLIDSGYEYAKNTLLVPFAWLQRAYDTLLERNKSKGDIEAHNKFNERIELMKDLNMIK